jgi:hypothetical protein
LSTQKILPSKKSDTTTGITDVKLSSWLQWRTKTNPSVSKSENLKKVRQRTDQMIKQQATQKERQENEAQQTN